MSHTISHITSHASSRDSFPDMREQWQDDYILLDGRYHVSRDIEHASHEQRFAAYHVELATPVSITVLHPRGIGTTAGRATRLRESSASSFWKLALQAANLRHPVLPRVRDTFLKGDIYYVITDDHTHSHSLENDAPSLPNTQTLAQRLERAGHISLREALIFGLQLCDALAYLEQVAPPLLPLTTIAPRHLIVPRPNAIIIGDLRPARWLDAMRCVCASADLPYYAPEVADGGKQDARADIYSIAAVMYHMLAGAPPIPPTAGDERRTLTEIEPLIPAPLSDVIELAMRHDPDTRFTDASAFGRALADALTRLLPALVAHINTNVAVSPANEQTGAHKESPVSKAATMLMQSGSGENQHALQYAETATPAITYRGNEPLIRRRPPKHHKRTPLEAISAALGLQPKTQAWR